MGSNRFCLWKHDSDYRKKLTLKEGKNLKGRSTFWIILIVSPQTYSLRIKEALLYVFEDNEAVIKMIIKGRSPTMRHVSRTHRVTNDWFLDRINLDPKIQIKYIDTKNQLADILTKGNFTRDEWNHLLCLFNISHFSSTDCSEVMSKRTQKDSGEERITAKSKTMMNLVSRCSVRNPNVLASTASESPMKTRSESQVPLSSWNEQQPRTERPVMLASSSNSSEWNTDKTWSSQEWKSDELMEGRTGRPVLFAQHTDRFIVENDNMDSYTEAESDMSFKSRSFLHRVNDQVRKWQYQSLKDAAKDSDKHSVMWWMFMSSTLQASVFMVKNYSDSLHSIKNTEDLTMKQLFDISEKLISEQSDEIYEVNTINWEDSSLKHLSLVGGEKVISLSHKRFPYFQILCYACLGKMNENPQSNYAWDDRLMWFRSSSEYWALDTIDGEPIEFEWNIFPGFTTLQLISKVQEFLLKMSIQPEESLDGLSSCRCSTTSHGDPKTMKRNANLALSSFLFLQKDFHQENGHSSDLDQRRNCILLTNTNHKENGTESLNKWWWNSQKADTHFSVLRVYCHEERSKAMVVDNYQYTSVLMVIRLKLFFAQLFLLISSVFTEQSQICLKNAKPATLERGHLFWWDNLTHCLCPVWWRQTHFLTDDLAQEEDLLQKYQERVDKLSQQNREIKFCTDAGFLTTVEIGQYFMTEDTEEFSQFTDSVACREYTLPRDEKSSDTKGWIRGNTKIGPVLEVTTSYLQGKHGVEIRIESINKDNSHSWVRIFHGLNKLVTDLSNKEDDDNEQETSEMKSEEFALKTNFCNPIKG